MKYLVLTSLLFISLVSCKQDEAKPVSSDYFPTQKDSRWMYSEAKGNSFQTLALGDTVINDTAYAKLGTLEGYATTLIRKEKGRYFSRLNVYGRFQPENLFLQDNQPVGTSWTSLTPEGKQIHTIVAINAQQTIDNKSYQQTIEVKTDYYNKEATEFSFAFTHNNVYAQGIGLIKRVYGQPEEYILVNYEIK